MRDIQCVLDQWSPDDTGFYDKNKRPIRLHQKVRSVFGRKYLVIYDFDLKYAIMDLKKHTKEQLNRYIVPFLEVIL